MKFSFIRNENRRKTKQKKDKRKKKTKNGKKKYKDIVNFLSVNNDSLPILSIIYIY